MGISKIFISVKYRYNLPVIFVIFNNNGIYGGVDKNTFDELKSSGDPCLKYALIKSHDCSSSKCFYLFFFKACHL